MGTVFETNTSTMPAQLHRHRGCANCQPQEEPQTTTSPTASKPMPHFTSTPNTSKVSQHCEIHPHSYPEKQPHCTGLQVHLHNHSHAHHSHTKPRHSTSVDSRAPYISKIQKPSPSPSHACGHDEKITHTCFAPLKAPYPHSGRCSLHLDFPHEPDDHSPNYYFRRDIGYGNSEHHDHHMQHLPPQRPVIACHRVWGPPLPSQEGAFYH